MCLTKTVYCFHCGKQFVKEDFVEGEIEDFEDCPHCGKGFDDLSEESQKAVKMTLKGIKESLDNRVLA